MLVLFWFSLFVILYTYVLYPLILRLFFSNQPPIEQPVESWPSVSVIIAAYNEESCIGQRIDNLLQQDYAGQLSILVGSDGSKDKTGEIIQSFTDERVRAYNFSENRGKISVLNDLISKADGEYLVFSDANTLFDNDAISRLIATFTDKVGAVSGQLNLVTDSGNQNQDGLYWQYEQFIKKREASLGNLLGANGAIYALKRSLFRPLPTDTIVDDFCIVMNAKKQGYDVLYNERAVATEEVAPNIEEEIGRRVRIGTGNYKAFFANLWALSPTRGLFAWNYWSHKVLRWYAPHFMVITLFTNIFLLNLHPVYPIIFLGQIGFYGAGFWALSQINADKKVAKLWSIVGFFVSMNVALLRGFYRFCFGSKTGVWKRTARQNTHFK